ncbi:MAG TPA: cytochrome P450, partial [Sporichthya sp.]|nr:cytochrome P450 [Sporichthya sp.]
LDAALASGGPVDLIGDYAYPLTASVIAEMLGVPREDHPRFRDWSDRLAGLVFGSLGDPQRHAAGAAGMAELAGYLTGLVRAHEREPADDLLSALINARDADDALSPDEVVSTGVLLLFAGHETTTALIGTGLLALVRHPDQRARLEADPALAETAVGELLRYDGPAKTVVRVMNADVELRGRTLRRGDRVFLCPAAANRDPAVFHDPDRLDITRREERQLGFGLGLHYCLGAPLARLEVAVAIPRALQRLPGLRPVDAELAWQSALLSRSLRSFPVEVGS